MKTEKNVKKKKTPEGEKTTYIYIYIYKLASRAIVQSVTGSGRLSCSVKHLNRNN